MLTLLKKRATKTSRVEAILLVGRFVGILRVPSPKCAARVSGPVALSVILPHIAHRHLIQVRVLCSSLPCSLIHSLTHSLPRPTAFPFSYWSPPSLASRPAIVCPPRYCPHTRHKHSLPMQYSPSRRSKRTASSWARFILHPC